MVWWQNIYKSNSPRITSYGSYLKNSTSDCALSQKRERQNPIVYHGWSISLINQPFSMYRSPLVKAWWGWAVIPCRVTACSSSLDRTPSPSSGVQPIGMLDIVLVHVYLCLVSGNHFANVYKSISIDLCPIFSAACEQFTERTVPWWQMIFRWKDIFPQNTTWPTREWGHNGCGFEGRRNKL